MNLESINAAYRLGDRPVPPVYAAFRVAERRRAERLPFRYPMKYRVDEIRAEARIFLCSSEDFDMGDGWQGSWRFRFRDTARIVEVYRLPLHCPPFEEWLR